MPRKCRRHAGPGKPPKDCVDCQEAARLAGPAPVRKPRLAAGPSAPATTVQEEAAALLRRVEAALAPRKATQPIPPPSASRPTRVILFKEQKAAPVKPKDAKPAHSPNGQAKKEPAALTPAMLRQRQRIEAQQVLRDIELLGGMHQCYDCPHSEEDHVLGECVLCWDERTRYHPFVSFLTGANRFFADVLSAPSEPISAEPGATFRPVPIALDYSYEAAVG